MALKTHKISDGVTQSTGDMLLKLVPRLGAGECYLPVEVAGELGRSREAVVLAARRLGLLDVRYGLGGNSRAQAVIVNPAHKKKGAR